MSHLDSPAVDIGPPPAAPSWCMPGAVPEQWLTDNGVVNAWSRDFGPDVWIACEDRVVDGRVRRSEPRVFYNEPSSVGLNTHQAREMARRLIAAADTLGGLA